MTAIVRFARATAHAAARVACPLASLAAATGLSLVLTGAAARRADAQPQSVQVIPPQGGDTLASVTPTFVVVAVGAGPGPLRFRFEIDTSRTFARALLDTTVTISDSVVAIRPSRALDGGVRIYWRATVLNPAGAATISAVDGPRRVPRFVTPLRPTGFAGTIVYTRRPTFVWRSPQVAEPPGPWEYTIQITNFGRTVQQERITDTTYTVPPGAELETNASYAWSITARLRSTGQSEIAAAASFSIIDSLVVPTATLLYQNFPNPFPNARTRSTCIWFDVAQPTSASLEIFDAARRPRAAPAAEPRARRSCSRRGATAARRPAAARAAIHCSRGTAATTVASSFRPACI